MTDAYRTFLEDKIKLAVPAGFAVDPDALNPALKPHVRVATQWALAGGRRLLASRFGTQKTTWHLEVGRLTMRETGQPHLIVMPLGARLSFYEDAERYFAGAHAIRINWVDRDGDLDPAAINLTNVERVREGLIDPRRFGSTTFDEGDILRNMGTKTFWTFTERAKEVRYRHVATATPDPREYAELLAFAGYLDIMDVGGARTRFFKRDSEQADNLTLHPHKEEEFWLWVASWALFISRPSDVDPAFSDDGYDLPALDVRWHMVATDHATAGADAKGQLRLLKDSSTGIQGAAREKRESLPTRVAKMMELRVEQPGAHRLIWQDLEDERRAIEKAVPGVVSVYGSQDVRERERRLVDFQRGRIAELAGKPVMIGSGPNYQYHCWWAIFLGVGWKFKDFIQAVHRVQRYGQTFEGFPADRPKAVRIDIIYTEAEMDVVGRLQANWRRYDEQAARMSALVRERGLAQLATAQVLTRTMEIPRVEARGDWFVAVNNDCVDEVRTITSDSVDLIHTSIPFGMAYEYCANYRDFGHTDGDGHFFAQMDFLTGELLRVLKPGRVASVHCKDRIVEGARSGLGFQTVEPFGAKTLDHFRRHGFAYIGTRFVITDVVRENNQTYRLGWTEQCKDGSRMGFGLIEYVHRFRKPQTDRGRGYADEPVEKLKRDFDGDLGAWVNRDPRSDQSAPHGDRREPYSRGRWQTDAAPLARSSGNRLLTPCEIAFELAGMRKGIYRRWKEWSLAHVYDHETHVAVAEALDVAGKLPVDYSIIPTHSWHPAVLTDVVRMRGLNTMQAARNREKHICPLPFDIVEREIRQCSMPGDLVLDPFAGLFTVVERAVRLGRRGYGVELNPTYFGDGARYCQAAEDEMSVPSLFDLIDGEQMAEAAE